MVLHPGSSFSSSKVRSQLNSVSRLSARCTAPMTQQQSLFTARPVLMWVTFQPSPHLKMPKLPTLRQITSRILDRCRRSYILISLSSIVVIRLIQVVRVLFELRIRLPLEPIIFRVKPVPVRSFFKFQEVFLRAVPVHNFPFVPKAVFGRTA